MHATGAMGGWPGQGSVDKETGGRRGGRGEVERDDLWRRRRNKVWENRGNGEDQLLASQTFRRCDNTAYRIPSGLFGSSVAGDPAPSPAQPMRQQALGCMRDEDPLARSQPARFGRHLFASGPSAPLAPPNRSIPSGRTVLSVRLQNLLPVPTLGTSTEYKIELKVQNYSLLLCCVNIEFSG